MKFSDIVGTHNCFATRVWGFTPDSWGALGFPKEGTAHRWSAYHGPLFVVCFVSHNARPHIAKEDVGRTLGIYELGQDIVHLESDGVIHPNYLTNSNLRLPNGRFRWPLGLKAVRAWRYDAVAPLTIETMPICRSKGQDVSTGIVKIDPIERNLLEASQHKLHESAVYGQVYRPKFLTDPNAVPDHIYTFVCDDPIVLARLPRWKPGEILLKIGKTSFVENRLANFNDHPLSKIIGTKFSEEANRFVGTSESEACERRLEDIVAKHGRPASIEKTEFYFVPDLLRPRIAEWINEAANN
jgi:hypothetical protein